MPSKSKQPRSANAPGSEAAWNYEASVSQVESIIAQLETGELSLEEVFDQFGQAVVFLQQCEAYLGTKQAEMDLLIETLEK